MRCQRDTDTHRHRIYVKEYYSQVKDSSRDIIELLGLPHDFRYRCPLCGAGDCAQFIGYYCRGVIDERGTYYNAFPIARYLCNGKETALTVKDRTFSLLPYQLVPYSKYCIPFIVNVLMKVYGEDSSVKELLDYLAGFKAQEYTDLSANVFYGFRAFILTAITRCCDGFLQRAQSATANTI